MNKTKLFVNYDGVNIYRIRFKVIDECNTKLKLKRCVMCEKPIHLDKSFSLLLNNCVLFPNVLLHDECIVEDNSLTLIDNIIYRYNMFKDFWNKRDIWVTVIE